MKKPQPFSFFSPSRAKRAKLDTSIFQILFLQTEDNPESRAAYEWLLTEFPHARRLALRELPSSGKNKILWWHGADRQKVEEALSEIAALNRFVKTGGRVFLSLAAVLAVVPLRLETQAPDVCEDGDYHGAVGDFEMHGLMSFLRHPIFSKIENPGGSHSGIYLWKPRSGEPHWRFGYGPETWPKGKVWGVHRFYIGFDSRYKLAWEYDEPRVLCVGAYLRFADRTNLYYQHTRRFTGACLEYLREPLPPNRLHWQETLAAVKLWKKRLSASFEFSEQRLRYVEATPKLEAPPDTNSFFDLTGERILLIGHERGLLTEIWSHPLRLCRNLSVKIRARQQIQPSATLMWDSGAQARVIIRPQHLERRSDAIVEHLWVAVDQPLACLDWRFAEVGEIEIEISFEVDFRLLWPYPEGCLSEIKYTTSSDGQQLWFTDARGLFIAQFALSGGGLNPVVEDISTAERSCARVIFRRRINTSRAVRRRKTLQLTIIGGAADDFDLKILQRDFPARLQSLYSAQAKRQQLWLEQHAEIDSPDPEFNVAARWAKLKIAAFVAEAPRLGKSLLAGFAPAGESWYGGRPGYAWFFGRHACWTALAMLHYGDFDNVRAVLELLSRHQEFTGKILHELSTNGAAHYDAADSTPLYIVLMARYLDHTGDLDFVRRQWPHVRKAMEFMFSTDRDGDGMIENTAVGHGWIEGGTLYGVHVEHYLAGCWAEALLGAARCAASLGEKADAEKWFTHHQRVSNVLENDFWNERAGYFYHGKRRDGSFDDNVTLLAAVPLLFGYGKEEQARRSLNRLAGKNFNADWGVRLVGNDHPLYEPQGYHSGSVWPLFSGWASLAAFKRGRPLIAMTQLRNSMRNFRHGALGCMEEVLHGEIYQPAGVCKHQAWSEAMVLHPIYEGLLGFVPRAVQHEVELTPRLPLSWHFFSAGPLRVGEHPLYFGMERDGPELKFIFSHRGPPLQLKFDPHFPTATRIESFRFGNQDQPPRVEDKFDERCVPFAVTLADGTQHAVYHISKCWTAIAPITDIHPGERSREFLIIREFSTPSGVAVEVEGDAGSSHRLEFVSWGWEIKAVRGGRLVSMGRERGAIDFALTEISTRSVRQVIEVDLE
jgi:glycogen debranching enzyme